MYAIIQCKDTQGTVLPAPHREALTGLDRNALMETATAWGRGYRSNPFCVVNLDAERIELRPGNEVLSLKPQTDSPDGRTTRQTPAGAVWRIDGSVPWADGHIPLDCPETGARVAIPLYELWDPAEWAPAIPADDPHHRSRYHGKTRGPARRR